MTDSPPPAPFRRVGAGIPASPVLLSVPHAGRNYSAALLGTARLPRAQLEVLEDRLVDQLIWRAVAGGCGALVATAPRAEIDLNRDEREIEAAMIAPRPHSSTVVESARTKGGLGLIPSRISGNGAIWRQRLPQAELARRIEAVYRPYHAALDQALEENRKRFGIAVLLDCHSMPPRSDVDAPAGIVLGDRYGASIAEDMLTCVEHVVRQAGYTVARNTPYAGGYITTRHGRPKSGVHALQIEIDRTLYLDRELRSPGAGFDRVARLLATIVETLTAKALEPPHVMAAE